MGLPNLPVSTERLKAILRDTELDQELQTLKHVILQGWPEVKGHGTMQHLHCMGYEAAEKNIEATRSTKASLGKNGD